MTRNSFPHYPKKKHGSGQARIRLNGKDCYLGPFGSNVSKKKYAELAAQFAGSQVMPDPQKHKATIGELTLAFLKAHSEMPEKEVWHYKRICKLLNRRHGHLPASMFGTGELSRLRTSLLAGDWMTAEERKHPKAGPWSVFMANRGVNKIRSLFRWGEEQGHVAPGVYAHLQALRPLSKATQARQTKPRQGIDLPALLAILPHLPPSVAALLEIQWWSGMRPSEAVRMKADNLEQREGVWFYWLLEHKNAWRPGREREAVILGPEAIRVLRPWLEAAKLKGKGVPIFPSGKTGRQYTVGGYAQAIARAFEEYPKLEKFTPYQCRHGMKRRVTRELGLDAARAALRQSSLETTAHYDSGRDMTLAIEAARKTG
jgi:integrase